MIRTLIILFIFTFSISATECSEEAGKGKVAEEGYKTASKIIDAIERFRIEHNDYPKALYLLVPKYIQELPDQNLKLKYSYFPRNFENKFILNFRYAGSGLGISACDYHSDKKEWRCYSYM